MVAAFSFLKVCDGKLQAQKCHKPTRNDELLRRTIEFCRFLAKRAPVISPKTLLD
jgi:hypothetical protein